MLFSRNIAPSCSYCRYGSSIVTMKSPVSNAELYAGGSCRRLFTTRSSANPSAPVLKKLREEMGERTSRFMRVHSGRLYGSDNAVLISSTAYVCPRTRCCPD